MSYPKLDKVASDNLHRERVDANQKRLGVGHAKLQLSHQSHSLHQLFVTLVHFPFFLRERRAKKARRLSAKRKIPLTHHNGSC